MVRFGRVAAAMAMMASPLLAQESMEDLKRELEQLRREVDGLKALDSRKEMPGTGKIDVEAMGAATSPVETLFKGTVLSGFVDAALGFSFNHLNSDRVGGVYQGINRNPIRLTDNSDQAFTLHDVVLQLERLATEDMIVGYHVELHAGHDPQVLDTGAIAVQEGWVQILAPVGNGLDIRVGRMSTLIGYEVSENTNNLNYGRGVVINMIEPITSTGVRATMRFVEQFSATIGFNNGPNFVPSGNGAFSDENHGKAMELQSMIKPIKDLMIALNFNVGNDTTLQNSVHDRFYIFNIVVAYTRDKLTLALNFDQASAEGAIGLRRAPLRGLAVYGKVQATDVFATGARIEYHSDGKGVALAPNVAAGDSGDGARVITLTLTQELKVAQHLIIRMEFRHDSSNQHIFTRNDNRAARGDNTFAVEALLPF